MFMTLSHCVGLVAHFTWRRRKYTSRGYWCSRSSRPYILSTSLAIRTVLAHTERSLSRHTLPHRLSQSHEFCYHEDTGSPDSEPGRAKHGLSVLRARLRERGAYCRKLWVWWSCTACTTCWFRGKKIVGTRSSIRSHHQLLCSSTRLAQERLE